MNDQPAPPPDKPQGAESIAETQRTDAEKDLRAASDQAKQYAKEAGELAAKLAEALRLADGARADSARLNRLENFIAWMRKRVDDTNKFNTHTTLTMFLRKLDELDAPAMSPAQDAAKGDAK